MTGAEQELAELRDTVLALTDEIATVAAGQVGPAAAAVVREVAAGVRRQTYQIVVCGEFKRGKSSLLNALIGHQQLFPTGGTLTTATLMVVRYGPRARAVARVRTTDGEIEEEIALDALARYVTTANGGEAYRVSRVDVQLPDPLMETGVVLVDTPGIGGVDEVHAAITDAILPDADALVLVLSALRPASVGELDFAQRALATRPATIIALTMADKVIDVGERVDRARERLATYLNLPADELRVLPVSATEAWAARLAGDQSRLEASGLPELEHEVWTTLLTEAAARRLYAATDNLLERLTEASAPVAAELAALAGGDNLTAVLADLAEAERKAVAAGRDLADEGRFEQEFADRVAGIEKDFRDRLDEVVRQLETATEAAVPPTPEALAALARTAAAAAPQAFAALRQGIGGLAADWERRTQQRLRVLDLTPQDEFLVPAPPQRARERPEFTDAVTGGAKAAVAVGPTATALSTLFGTLIAGPIGAAAGAIVGSVASIASFFGGVLDQFRRANARARTRQLHDYRDQLLASLNDHRGNTLSLLEETQQRLLRNLKLQLRTINRAQLETIDRARHRVQQSAQDSAERRAARAETLARQRDAIAGHAAHLHAAQRTLTAVRERVRGARTPDSGAGQP